MSRSERSSALEGIDRIGNGSRTEVGLQAVAAHNIDRPVEQARDVLLQSYVVEHRNMRLRIDLEHDVDIAAGPVLTPRDGTEQGSTPPPPCSERLLGTS